MGYSVGQIVYLLSRKNSRIFPSLITEQVSRRTLESEEVSYVVKLPDKKMSCVSLDNLDVDVFTSLDELKEKLISDALETVNSMVLSANEMKKNIFGDDAPDVDLSQTPGSDEYSEKISVDLGDGTKASFNIEGLT